jgi:prophage tail gpP-like protein
MPVTLSDADIRGIGDQYDSIALRVDGVETRIYRDYEVKISVLQQPAAFSLRLGWSGTAGDMLALYRKGQEFELMVGNTVIQSGVIDGVEVPSGGVTEIEVRGRDYMARLFNSSIPENQSFTTDTYYKLTRAILDKIGYQDRKLIVDNAANRQIIGHVKYETKSNDDLDINQYSIRYGPGAYLRTNAPESRQQMIFEALPAHIGATWYNFLHDQYKLAGLHLWCTGEGNFVLARPNLVQPYAFEIKREIRNDGEFDRSKVTDHRHKDDAAGRHSECRVYGRFGAGRDGRQKLFGQAFDQEMIACGFNQVIALHGTKAKTQKDAEYLARRQLAEERRMGWQLAYQMPGHRLPSEKGSDGYVTPCPDMIAHVEDNELQIFGDFYVESLTYARRPFSFMWVELMRPDDVKYLAETPE